MLGYCRPNIKGEKFMAFQEELMSKLYLDHSISLLLLNERYFSKEGLAIVSRIGYNISHSLFAFIGFIFITLEASPILIGKILRKLKLH